MIFWTCLQPTSAAPEEPVPLAAGRDRQSLKLQNTDVMSTLDQERPLQTLLDEIEIEICQTLNDSKSQ